MDSIFNILLVSYVHIVQRPCSQIFAETSKQFALKHIVIIRQQMKGYMLKSLNELLFDNFGG